MTHIREVQEKVGSLMMECRDLLEKLKDLYVELRDE